MGQPIRTRYELDPERLRQVMPNRPGVYLFTDRTGRVIYVGKAKSLRKRVLSYFRPRAELSKKTSLMMRRARGVECVLTATEQEAFLLESNLVKVHLPRYNIILRDDKRFPCLRLDMTEPYPRLTIARKIKKDGALYFGPFSSANSVRSTLKVIDRVFQLRKCKDKGLPKRDRPCLNHQMDRCLAPCAGEVSPAEYGEMVQRVKLFLEGRNRELTDALKQDMDQAADRLDFEKAARMRDQLRAVERTVEQQYVVSSRMENQDVIGLARRGARYQVVLLLVRNGCLVGSRDYLLRHGEGSASEVVEAFLKQYYSREDFIPDQILVPIAVEDVESIGKWFSHLARKGPPLGKGTGTKGRRPGVEIRRPLRGQKMRLVEMAEANAENLLASRLDRAEYDLMEMVQSTLNLDQVPTTIEGMDISALHGKMAVGTVVAFVEGEPHRRAYRNYRIRAVEGVDDYGMMTELVERRVGRGDLPDLFLVDGGKGHLSVVQKVLAREKERPAAKKGPFWGKPGGSRLPSVIAIAKPDNDRGERLEKLYVPGRKNAIRLRADHPVLLLMMRIRDEAHRRAVSYHRRLRKRRLTSSELDRIPGIGTQRKRTLLTNMGDITRIADASVEELARVPGINRKLAADIVSYFRGL